MGRPDAARLAGAPHLVANRRRTVCSPGGAPRRRSAFRRKAPQNHRPTRRSARRRGAAFRRKALRNHRPLCPFRFPHSAFRFGIRDTRLVERALREHWPIPESPRSRLRPPPDPLVLGAWSLALGHSAFGPAPNLVYQQSQRRSSPLNRRTWVATHAGKSASRSAGPCDALAPTSKGDWLKASLARAPEIRAVQPDARPLSVMAVYVLSLFVCVFKLPELPNKCALTPAQLSAPT